MARSSGLLEAIKSATADDLAAIQERIEELTRELESLKQAERLLSVRLNGKPERKVRAKKKPEAPSAAGSTATNNSQKLCERIYEVIAANGPGAIKEISLKVNATVQQVAVAVARCDWFEQLDSGKVVIATAGGRKGKDLD